MRQSSKIQSFKLNQEVSYGLSTVFDPETGFVINNHPNNGLLILDDIALFLLILCQLVTGKLQICYTNDDVDFCQNLVYYLERAYRVADHGPHEEVVPINCIVADQKKSLHSSTIGLAKAALEAAYQCNLFGIYGTHSTKLHVDPDAHNRNRMTLESLLPRQSVEKKTDACLSIIVGFPCWAIDDEELLMKTIESCVSESASFQSNRTYSAALEVTGHLLGNNSNKMISKLLKTYTTKSSKLNLRDHSFNLMSYIICNDLLTLSELDPCHRFVQKLERSTIPIPLRSNPHQVQTNVILISESTTACNLLKSYGIKAQTIEQVHPVEIWSSKQLLKVFSTIGVNKALKLDDGRPDRPIGSLGTSQIYRIVYQDFGQPQQHSKLVIPYGLAFETLDFYSGQDQFLSIDKIWCSLHFLAKYWTMTSPPIFVLLVTDETLYTRRYIEKSATDPGVTQFLSMVNSIKAGCWQGISTKITTVSEAIHENGNIVHLEPPLDDFCSLEENVDVQGVDRTLASKNISECLDFEPTDFTPKIKNSLADRPRSLSQKSNQSQKSVSPSIFLNHNSKDLPLYSLSATTLSSGPNKKPPNFRPVFNNFNFSMTNEELLNYISEQKEQKNQNYLALLVILKKTGRIRDLVQVDPKMTEKYFLEQIESQITFCCKNNFWHLARLASNEMKKVGDALAPSITALLSIGINYVEIHEMDKAVDQNKNLINRFFQPEKPKKIFEICLFSKEFNYETRDFDLENQNGLKQELLRMRCKI